MLNYIMFISLEVIHIVSYMRIVRDLELFYKLFLIDPTRRTSVQLCPFVKSGKMHKDFTPYLRKDGLGIDYSKDFFTNYDTESQLEEVLAGQRPGGEKMIQNAMKHNNREALEYALENARRIKLDKTNPALVAEGDKMLRQMN